MSRSAAHDPAIRRDYTSTQGTRRLLGPATVARSAAARQRRETDYAEQELREQVTTRGADRMIEYVEHRDQRRPRLVARSLPRQLLGGVALVALSWPVAWLGWAPLSEHTFFPLWLGYILTLDGLVARRTTTSLLTRNRPAFVLLFVFSILLWWLFEGANHLLKNWHYLSPHAYGRLYYALLASLSFSTVIPALFETAEFYRSFRFFQRPRRWLRIAPSQRGLLAIAGGGAALCAIALLAPRQGFGLIWLGLFFLLDSVNALTGRTSLAGRVAHGHWDTVLVLFAAGLTCGFFWEMWNYWSMPKWVYTIPYIHTPKLFEMPLPGYGGYLPFALEVYAVYQALAGLVMRPSPDYLVFDRPLRAGRAIVASRIDPRVTTSL